MRKAAVAATVFFCAPLLLSILFSGCAADESAMKTYKPSFHAPAASDGLVFNDKELQFQLLRALGSSAYGCSDTGECLEIAMQVDENQLKKGDFETWYDAWNQFAMCINGIAGDCLARGDAVSARDAYLRAETYYRMAEFYLHGNPGDPRIRETSGKARSCFRKAAELMDNPVEEVKIDYENTTLPGYFYSIDGSGKKRPLLIMQTGFDGTQEELYAGGVKAALERGYNVLTFEGPGQGEVLREQNLYFRPDWEKVVTPVVDYAVTRDDVDKNNISLWGVSMGGYLSARAAAFEHRLKALITDPGMDMSKAIVAQFGEAIKEISGDPGFKPTRDSVAAFIEENEEQFNEGILEAMKGNIHLTWFMQNGMYSFGVDTPAEFVLRMLDYSLEEVSPKIECATLICDSDQDEGDFGPVAREIYDSLTCDKDYVLFTNAEGAGAHCQMGAFRFAHPVKLDWLGVVTRRK
ncbi:MAG: alpha/beta fold hydrolase [Actinobacteria bacterium]|nr:alpha/beta fold hydrolase [Actinomycetota bacterium]